MDKRILKYDCQRCKQLHEIEVDFDVLSERQRKGIDPILTFICPNVARMYKVCSFAVDTRARILNNDALKNLHGTIVNSLIKDWGEFEFDKKLKRFKNLDLSFLGIPEEYYYLLWDVVSSYCCGRFFTAMTSAGSLGERILNRLIIKTRDYYKTSPYYKQIYRKNSFDQWEKPICILEDWGVISTNVAKSFDRLKKYRNDSIHYNDGYDFDMNSHNAVISLAEIINGQFNYEKRQDLFWVYHVPGEILLKSDKIDEPFVKEFVIPHCVLITPYCEPTATPPIVGTNTPIKPLSDEDFIRLRKSRNEK